MKKQFETQKEQVSLKGTESSEETATPTTTGSTPKPKPKADTPSEIIKPGGGSPKEIGGGKSFSPK